MKNILLIEPDYRSKFPPLGLMRLATYHRDAGDNVTFARGCDPKLASLGWDRVYVSSLFTYELPRTVKTLRFYGHCVADELDLVVGGVGATLMPEYIRQRIPCRIVSGTLEEENRVEDGSPAIALLPPAYDLIDSSPYHYKPSNSYFCRATLGCPRKCAFCAVPRLEGKFGFLQSPLEQIQAATERHGERRHLVMLDNNVLGCPQLESIIADIASAGFEAKARHGRASRTVDFNQGLDARLVTAETARLLSTICLTPIRLALDYDAVEGKYREAIDLLVQTGFCEFTTYVMFNYQDTPQSLYHRLRLNAELSESLNVRIAGFPMKYVPIDDVTRKYIAPAWKWRYLRGIQCILLATRGLVSPHLEFFEAAFGSTWEEFVEIISMPDRYIIHRKRHHDAEAAEWSRMYRKLLPSERDELMDILDRARISALRTEILRTAPNPYRGILQHYYPNGQVPHD